MELIVPPKIETTLTGFVLGAQKQYGGKTWRVELWRGHERLRVFIYRNNDKVLDGDYPRAIHNLVQQLTDFYLQGQFMKDRAHG